MTYLNLGADSLKRLTCLLVWSIGLIETAAFSIAAESTSKPEQVEVKVLDEAEQAFVAYYGHYVKGVTDSVATFEVTVSGARREVTQTRQFSVEAKQAWLYGRFVIYQAKPLTAADGLNGVEFDGVARVEADAIRLTAAAGSDPEALAVVKGRHKELNGPWQAPGGAEFERYSIKRVKGEWRIAEYDGGWSSDYKALRTHWLCGKPRPEPVPVDEAKLTAEALAAFDQLKHSTTDGGFTLRYLGYDDPLNPPAPGAPVKVHDLLVEYRRFGAPKLELVRVTAAERANGIEWRFLLRAWDGAKFVREATVRELRAGEAKPLVRCSSPGTKVDAEWAALKLLLLTAERTGGVWRFSTGVGEVVGE